MLGLSAAVVVALLYAIGMLVMDLALGHHYPAVRRNIFSIAWITAAPGCLALVTAGMCGPVRELGRYR